MIGFPLLGDQKYNAIRMEYKGYGVIMNIFEFTEDQLFSNIQLILSDKRFAERVSRASEIFKDAVEKPAEKAARWVEHVLQFGGNHLRSVGTDLRMHEYFMLDVLILILVACAIITAVVNTIIKMLF